MISLLGVVACSWLVAVSVLGVFSLVVFVVFGWRGLLFVASYL